MLMQKITILYYPEENIFKTADGQIVLNIYPLVSPSQILLFKHRRKTIEILNSKYGLIVRMLYPLSNEGG